MSKELHDLTHICQQFIKKNTNIEAITFDTLQRFYVQLVDCITDNNHLYYIDASPLISDKEYDELFAYLIKIEESHPELINENSPTQQLIGQIADGFEKAEHVVPMLSLENSYNSKDLYDYNEFIQKRVNDISYYVEPKFDGIAVEVIYKDGKLHQAITRGDGKVGEDITVNTKTIKNLPKKLSGKTPQFLSLRGEIMMPKSTWQELNQQREELGLNPFANTRNAASGSMKLLDSSEVAQRGLVCFVYDLMSTDSELVFTSAEEQRQQMLDRGLPVFPRIHVYQSIEEIIKLCEDENVQHKFFQEDIDFDGLVIKVNELHAREELGSTQHHPRWAMAFKFPAQQVATQIESVDFQIGRTGIVTPVGNLTPVQLSGVTISRVSLHNFDFIKEKDIHISDRVWIQRSGEVIPYVMSVVKDRRKEVRDITPPITCPVCDSPISNIDGHNYCTNTKCPAILKGKLTYFVSKQCMNIDGVGESIIDILVDQNIVQSLPDLYKVLDNEVQQQLKRLPGFGDKKVAHMVQGLTDSKNIPLRRFFNALSLPGIGKKTAQSLEKKLSEQENQLTYQSIKNMLSDKELMESIDGIGEIIVEGLYKYFQQAENISDWNAFETIGIEFTTTIKTTNGPLSGQNFSLTGSFPISRDKLVELFEAQGATFQSSPNKKTTFMLIGEKPGSKKAKAEKLGLPTHEGRGTLLTEFTFLTEEPVNKPQQTSLFG